MRALGDLEKMLGSEAQLVLVGGAVRDMLLGRNGGDWDLATALLPEEVCRRARAAGLKAIPTGIQHGTVTVMLEGRPVEITTYRGDGAYLDGRHPESIRLGASLEEDLARRDFTINAMAIKVRLLAESDEGASVIDPFGGREDLGRRMIRAVGDPLLRFQEDGLRALRACRFASQLDFDIEEKTFDAISKRLGVSAKVSVERVLVELTKLLTGQNPPKGLRLLERSGLMDLWMPELRALVGCSQNRHHDLDVWEHTLQALANCPPDPALRWAVFLHDAGKPECKTGEGPDCHFYCHEAASARVAETILRRLKAGNVLLEKALGLIRRHGDHLEGDGSDRACRRLLKRLVDDRVSIEDWIAVRMADRSGKRTSGIVDHGETLALKERLLAIAEAKPPMKPQDLALDGRALMTLAKRKGGPWLGELQKQLLEAVLDNPGLNTPEELTVLAESALKGEILRQNE